MARQFDIRGMRQLLAVRDYGSIAKAAQALGMSQPSLSAALARLEDQLKARLFERTPQGSNLTALGELIADRATRVVGEAEQILRDAALVAGGETGAIRIGVGTALTGNFLPRLVRRLADRYPGLSLAFEVLDRDRLVPMVVSRDIDLAVCGLGDAVTHQGLVATEVLTSTAVAVAHPGHELARVAGVSKARFAEFPSAGASMPRFSNRSVLGVDQGAERLLQYQANSYEPLLELALMGRTTLLAPLFVVQPYLQNGRLKLIDLDWSFRVSFAAISTRAASYSPVISRVIAEAVSIGMELQAEGDAIREAAGA